MRRNKLFFGILISLFFVVETALGILLQCSSGRAVSVFSFLSVVLACLFCLLFMARTKAYLLTQTALIFTVAADYFLVLSNPQIKLPAMLAFLVTQLCYGLRIFLTDENEGRKRVEALVRIVLSFGIVIATAAVLGRDCDLLAPVSMLYYLHLLLNVVFAFLRFKRNAVLAFGLLLFILCDTLIGLAMLESYFPVNSDLIGRIVHPGFDLAWAFYLPAQMLLAVSLLPAFKGSCKNKERARDEL